jgi:phosphoribosylamine-glycine ligase
MIFHLFTTCGDSLPLVNILSSEGHKVNVFIQDSDCKKLYEGIATKFLSETMWANQIKKEDIVIFDSNSPQIVAMHDLLIKRGITNIIGGTEFAFKLESDRAFGMRLLAENGIKIPDTYIFKNKAEAVKYLKANEGKYVYKPSGDTQEGSAQTYVAVNGIDLIDFIEAQPERDFILQKFVENGVGEIGNELYFRKGEPIYPLSHTFETKKFMPGNLGQNTGCMSSVTWWDNTDNAENDTFNQTWANLLAVFKKEQYTGACDISGIIDKDGIFWALELTPRFGYSQEWALWQITLMKIGEMLEKVSRGTIKEIKPDMDYYGFAMRLSIPPYPLESTKDNKKEYKKLIEFTNDTPIVVKEKPGITYHLMDVKAGKGKYQGKLLTAGVDGIVGELCCRDKSIENAQKRILEAAKDVLMGDLQYRNDCFSDAEKGIKEFQRVGYWGRI